MTRVGPVPGAPGPTDHETEHTVGIERSSNGRTALAVDAWESYFRGYNAVMRHFELSGAFGELSGREYDVLLHLSRGPEEGLRQRDLMREAMLPQPSLSRLLRRLEERGLVALDRVENDRRGRQVTLTKEGRDLQRAVGRVHARAIRGVLADLEEEDLESMAHLGRRLIAVEERVPDVPRD